MVVLMPTLNFKVYKNLMMINMFISLTENIENILKTKR